MLTVRDAGAEEGVDSNRWALLSDTHIPSDPTIKKGNADMTAHLQASLAEIKALPKRPVGLMVNGDCPYDFGVPEEYAHFVSLMKPVGEMKVPMHFTLGNHDRRENFWNALTEAAALPRPVAGKQVSIVESPAVNWFLLDSLEVTKQVPGRLGAEQLDWLTKALDARADKPALIMVHHHPAANDPGKPAGIADAEAFLAIILPRRQVKAVFFGHTHVWQMTQREGMHLVNLPAVAYPFKETEPTGWVNCEIRPTAMTLELRAHNTEHPAHGKVHELAWRA